MRDFKGKSSPGLTFSGPVPLWSFGVSWLIPDIYNRVLTNKALFSLYSTQFLAISPAAKILSHTDAASQTYSSISLESPALEPPAHQTFLLRYSTDASTLTHLRWTYLSLLTYPSPNPWSSPAAAHLDKWLLEQLECHSPHHLLTILLTLIHSLSIIQSSQSF